LISHLALAYFQFPRGLTRLKFPLGIPSLCPLPLPLALCPLQII
jgi:hypothetical protein